MHGEEKGCLPERFHALQDGATPLHRAAMFGHAAVVQQLVAAGAAVDAKDQVRGEWAAHREGMGGKTQLCVSF